jgi:hypothetical protein
MSQIQEGSQLSLPTAEKVMEDETNKGGNTRWMEAIERMEARQNRMERLLERMLENSSKKQ